jgi:tetratricopeptide (TPR) repeat protein
VVGLRFHVHAPKEEIVKSASFAVLFLTLSLTVFGQELSELSTPPNGDNERAEVSQWIGPVRISIEYHSPRVHNPATNDRTGHIWGELVHYGFFDEGFGPTKGAPWRAGANESTSISFSHDVKVEGKDLKAGTYALFLDVEKDGPWNWVFSNHVGWGSFQYDPKYDALRVPVTPQDTPFTEFLTYGFDERHPDSAIAFLQWEKKRIPFKVEVTNVNELYVAKMRQDLESWAGFRNEDWQTAAQFCADNKINLEEALTWADKAISGPFRGATVGQENFTNLQTKAAVLEAMGRDAEADTVMQKALHLPGAESVFVYVYGMKLLRSGKNSKAMEVFDLNQKQHPEEKFWTSLGLARGYSAVGDKKNAIANWEIVLRNVPANLNNRTPGFEAALKKLKESS